MSGSIKILKLYTDSFRANIYNTNPFRMIGIIDVGIIYHNNIERVTLPFYRSSGTNGNKIKGLWYPMIGIKMKDGRFTEFTPYINYILSNTTRHGEADKGWIVKSLFFDNDDFKIRGFSNGKYHKSLYGIGKTLRDLYESGNYDEMKSLNPQILNRIVMSNKRYRGNNNSQIHNFEKIIEEIYIRK